MSARSGILDSLVTVLKTIDGTGDFSTNLYDNVTKKLVFWDEVTSFPHISVVAGSESREYLPGAFKWGRLNISIKVYVHDEDPVSKLEEVLQDIELVLDNNNELNYSGSYTTQDIRLTSIETDEGLLNPYGVGDITIQILYEVQH